MGWWGKWFGDAGTGGGGGGVIITNNVTTAELIRDHIIELVEAITPTLLLGDKFERYLNEGDADFVTWCAAHPESVFRRFQVRDTGDDHPPDISNLDVESRLVTFEIRVAYPQTSRYGKNNALDRDDVMSADQHQIEHTVGLCGYANFTGASAPNAAWVEGATRRDQDGGIDFLVITQTMRFYRRMVVP